MLGKKLLLNTTSLELYRPFDSQLIIYSVLVFLYFILLNVG